MTEYAPTHQPTIFIPAVVDNVPNAITEAADRVISAMAIGPGSPDEVPEGAHWKAEWPCGIRRSITRYGSTTIGRKYHGVGLDRIALYGVKRVAQDLVDVCCDGDLSKENLNVFRTGTECVPAAIEHFVLNLLVTTLGDLENVRLAQRQHESWLSSRPSSSRVPSTFFMDVASRTALPLGLLLQLEINLPQVQRCVVTLDKQRDAHLFECTGYSTDRELKFQPGIYLSQSISSVGPNGNGVLFKRMIAVVV